MEHTTPASIAAALRRAADDLDAMGDVELAPISVQLNLQAVTYTSTPQGRRCAVDALGIALTGHAGEQREDDTHYRIPYKAIYRREDANVAVYTNLTDVDHHPTRHVCQPSELTEVRLSNCESGCKVFTCSGCDVERVVHSAVYGCTEAGAR